MIPAPVPNRSRRRPTRTTGCPPRAGPRPGRRRPTRRRRSTGRAAPARGRRSARSALLLGAPETDPGGIVAANRSAQPAPRRSRPSTVETRCTSPGCCSTASRAVTSTVPGHADVLEVVAHEVDDHDVLGLVLGQQVGRGAPGALDRGRRRRRPRRARGTAPGEALTSRVAGSPPSAGTSTTPAYGAGLPAASAAREGPRVGVAGRPAPRAPGRGSPGTPRPRGPGAGSRATPATYAARRASCARRPAPGRARARTARAGARHGRRRSARTGTPPSNVAHDRPPAAGVQPAGSSTSPRPAAGRRRPANHAARSGDRSRPERYRRAARRRPRRSHVAPRRTGRPTRPAGRCGGSQLDSSRDASANVQNALGGGSRQEIMRTWLSW